MLSSIACGDDLVSSVIDAYETSLALIIALQDILSTAPYTHLGAPEQRWRVLYSTFDLASPVATQFGDELSKIIDVTSGACLCGSGWNLRATTVSICALADFHCCIEIMCMCIVVIACSSMCARYAMRLWHVQCSVCICLRDRWQVADTH